MQYAQGDILIERIDTPAEKTDHRRAQIILARGEITGHKHIMTGDLCRVSDSIISAINGATVRHDQHGPIDLPSGSYRITRQREWVGARSRRVRD